MAIFDNEDELIEYHNKYDTPDSVLLKQVDEDLAPTVYWLDKNFEPKNEK